MTKKFLVAVLGLCIIVLAGADVCLYMAYAQTDKIKEYSEEKSDNQQETDKKEKEKQNTESQVSGIVTTTMKGFTLGSQGIVKQNADEKEDGSDTDTKANGICKR